MLLSIVHPGVEPGDVEVLDRVSMGEGGEEHILVKDGSENLHIWIPSRSNYRVLDMDRGEFASVIIEQLRRFQGSRSFETRKGKHLRYQRFGQWKKGAIEELENGRMDILTETGTCRIRITSGNTRYIVEMDTLDLKGPRGTYIISRLNSVSYGKVPTLLGMSYWDEGGKVIPWMRLMSMEEPRGSGLAPFLADLNGLLRGFENLQGEHARRYLVDMSMPGSPDSVLLGSAYGASIAELHGKILLDRPVSEKGRFDTGAEITRLFSRESLQMTDIGSFLGLSSFYLTEIKKEFIKLLGDRERVNPASGRRMKVLKSERVNVEGIDLPALSILREGFIKKESSLRARFARLRRFTGSPMVPVGIDTRLERVEQASSGDLVIDHFDWNFHGSGEKRLQKFIPLKDLAMVLNSLSKARYLSSRKFLRKASASSGLDERQLSLLYLEYSMAKPDYSSILADLPLFNALGSRNAPFRYVFQAAVVTSLWYERVRNGVISGYSDMLMSMDRADMLDYPAKADTVEGMITIQCMLGLSEALRAIDMGKVSSTLGLESDLLNAVMFKDQA
ncbi:MAG: hypothetical protein JW939_08430 [Candidatus Thermoplasmatota archaeon]|nr:hypothetical protein [Candidatus Thermoplasmatota archaeon]